MSKVKGVPEDELILAELIAVASERGLTGCQGVLFRDALGVPCVASEASACCAMGAVCLTERYGGVFPTGLIQGNDALNYEVMPPTFEDESKMWWNIGAAFNLAMDPSNEV